MSAGAALPPPEPRLGDAVLLGLLQGPAELLPVSSSAHTGLLLRRRGLRGAARKEVEVALHAGTAVALAVLERRRAPWAVLVAATIPAAVAGLVLERAVEQRLGGPRSVAAGLVAGAAAMVAADRTPPRRGVGDPPGLADGAWLGVAQALALMPGVSRSGATRATARLRGFDRAGAAALSRAVALPVLAGAGALKGVRLAQRRPPAATVRALAGGAAAAALSTAAALRAERAVAADAPLAVWAAYRTALAMVVWHDRAR